METSQMKNQRNRKTCDFYNEEWAIPRKYDWMKHD